PDDIPGVLVNDHGPFTWGNSPKHAVYHSVVLEHVAEMAYHTMQINPDNIEISQKLLDKHYLRKHGDNAYYGQNYIEEGSVNMLTKKRTFRFVVVSQHLY